MRILLTIPLSALLIGCGSSSTTDTMDAAGTTPAKSVTIADFKFGAPLTVPKGTEVTFKNADNAPHNAVGDDFKTKDLKQGESDTVAFDKTGTYDYVCTFHPFMKGTIVVQ